MCKHTIALSNLENMYKYTLFPFSGHADGLWGQKLECETVVMNVQEEVGLAK